MLYTGATVYVCANRSAVRDCKGLRVHLIISIIKTVIQSLQYAYAHNVYCRQEPCGSLFTSNWQFVHVRQPKGLEYRLSFTVSCQSFDVLSGIWCEFDVIYLLLEGVVCLLGTVVL